MGKHRADAGTRILRRIKRRRPHLTRLLAVIRSFRRAKRIPLHRTVAAQIRVDLESRRSLRTQVADFRREQWALRRSLEPLLRRPKPSPLWTRQVRQLRRDTQAQGFAMAWHRLMEAHRDYRATSKVPLPRMDARRWTLELNSMRQRIRPITPIRPVPPPVAIPVVPDLQPMRADMVARIAAGIWIAALGILVAATAAFLA